MLCGRSPGSTLAKCGRPPGARRAARWPFPPGPPPPRAGPFHEWEKGSTSPKFPHCWEFLLFVCISNRAYINKHILVYLKAKVEIKCPCKPLIKTIALSYQTKLKCFCIKACFKPDFKTYLYKNQRSSYKNLVKYTKVESLNLEKWDFFILKIYFFKFRKNM